MKETLKLLLCSLLISGIVLTFVACGDDDNENSIVGTWIAGNKTMQLGNNGSYYLYYGNNPTGSESQYRKGTYSYNAGQGLMTVNIQDVPDHNSAYQRTYIVQTLTATTLVLLYTDGDVEGYYTRK